MTCLAFLAALAGFAGLALGMERHHRDLTGRKLEKRAGGRFRALGAALLAAAYGLAVAGLGAVDGSVAWFGLASLAAAVVLLSASRFAAKPRRR